MVNKSSPAQRASDRLQSRGFGHVVRWTIVLALWTLLISMAIGRFGISNYMQLRENANLLRDSNMKLGIENQMLQERLRLLEQSPTARRLFVMTQTGQIDGNQKIIHLNPIPTHPSAPVSVVHNGKAQERLAQNSVSKLGNGADPAPTKIQF
jgi:hypothetical protein